MRRKLGWWAVCLGLVVAPPATSRPRDDDKEIENIKAALNQYKYGEMLFERGQLDESIAAFRAALQLEPDEPYWHKALGDALNKKGDHEGATREYELAFKYSPHDDALDFLRKGLLPPSPDEDTPQAGPPTPNAPRYRAYKVGRGVVSPAAFYQPTRRSPYPEKARSAKNEGTVVISAIVNAKGKIEFITVAKPLGLGLDQTAIEMVRSWKFRPGTRNGAAASVWVTVELAFKLH